MHRGGRGSQQAHRVGTELPVLFGPAVRFGGAPVQTQHELQVLVRFLLVCQRPVVSAFVLRALVTPAAALQHGGLVSGHFVPGHSSGAGGPQQEDEGGQDEDTQEAVSAAGRPHVCFKNSWC